jgi:hypothetical protein
MGRKTSAICALFYAVIAVPQERPTFSIETNLQALAVQVTDRQGRDNPGLTAADETR